MPARMSTLPGRSSAPRFSNHRLAPHWTMRCASSIRPSISTPTMRGHTAFSRGFFSCGATTMRLRLISGERWRSIRTMPMSSRLSQIFWSIGDAGRRRSHGSERPSGSTRSPPNLYHWYHALALYSAHRYGDSIGVLREARAPDRWAHALLAACYAQIDRLSEARSEAQAFVRERCRELSEIGEAWPANTLELVRTRADRYRNPDDREHFLDGLRKAGLGGVLRAPIEAD